MSTIPVSAIIPTKDRLDVLIRTLDSLSMQSTKPSEVIIVDGSVDDFSELVGKSKIADGTIKLIYQKAIKNGAANQRLQGMNLASHPFIWFLDDDIILEEDCAKRLFEGFSYQENVGAVNAMIVNQRYTKPGFVTRCMYRIMHPNKLTTYAGKIIGPAWNLLPEDEPGLPDYVACEWLNTTCTIYRREAMPNPVFAEFFQGYSMFEDVTLSVMIGKNHILLNARTARIFHDSQPGSHKNSIVEMSAMTLVNRYYVMTRVLKRKGVGHNFKLLVLELFGMIGSLRSGQGRRSLPGVLKGKISGVKQILKLNRDESI